MKQELDRVKSDLETIQKAMRLAPSMGRDWVQWMKRDNWLNLWWCVPGIILIVSGLLPFGKSVRYWGLASSQWTGLLVGAVMLGITIISFRKMTAKDGRPDSLVKEYKRISGLSVQGAWFSLALLAGLLLFFLWGKQSGLSFGAFWSGLFIFMGSCCLVTAIASNNWLLLGWGIPFLGYGFFQTVLAEQDKVSGIPLGVMFIAVALSFSVIQVWQIGKSSGKMNPIDFNGLDTAVHGPIRLGIMTALQVDGSLDFTTLKNLLDTVDGSLNLHLSKLEECAYITKKKSFVGLRPKTTYKITLAGRRALANYLQSMKKLIDYLESAAIKESGVT